MLRTAPLLPLSQGLRRWAPTPPVSRRSRQPATGPPGSYPDRTHTGKQRRAYEHEDPPRLTSRSHLPVRWAHERSRLELLARRKLDESGQRREALDGHSERSVTTQNMEQAMRPPYGELSQHRQPAKRPIDILTIS